MADAAILLLKVFASLIVLFVLLVPQAAAIECFQCDSNEDQSCPADSRFDTEKNAVVDCNNFEANIPGQFCVRVYQEGPGWRPWKKITRRCSFFSVTGVAWGCRWVWEENGVFRESCYCNSDGCNHARSLHALPMSLVITASILSTLFVGSLFK